MCYWKRKNQVILNNNSGGETLFDIQPDEISCFEKTYHKNEYYCGLQKKKWAIQQEKKI